MKTNKNCSMVKDSSLLEETKNIEILGPADLSQLNGGIKIYIEKSCKGNIYANCKTTCTPIYTTLQCGH